MCIWVYMCVHICIFVYVVAKNDLLHFTEKVKAGKVHQPKEQQELAPGSDPEITYKKTIHMVPKTQLQCHYSTRILKKYIQGKNGRCLPSPDYFHFLML